MNNYYSRSIEAGLNKALSTFPVCLITGPRQTGKSTLLKNLLPNYQYVSLDDPLSRQLALEDPALFLSQYSAPVIIDEIQNAPKLFEYLKIKVDQKRQDYGQYVLTGSQVFQLMQGVGESLAGRVAVFNLYPFTWQEMKGIPRYQDSQQEDTTCFERMLYGFYPEFFSNPQIDPNLWYASYITTYIERDVRKIRSISDLGRFQTFLGLLAARAGNILNLSEISKECGITQPTAKDWISILESTYIIYLLKPYYKNKTKRLVKSPKLYFVDTGILCYLLGIDSKERLIKSPDKGAIFENMVIMETFKRLNNQASPFRCFFYRTLAKQEVDLIIEYKNQTFAYEIKFSKSPSKAMTKSLSTFEEEYPESQLSLLTLYEKELPINKKITARYWTQLPLFEIT